MTMTQEGQNGILLVQALFSFTGSNNDELCFKKGDLIVVTQREEGGWWEGTLDGNTGWFPSNYVKDYKPSESGGPSTITASIAESPPISPQPSQQQVVYRAMVSKEILESERHHVEELQNIFNKYLIPLQKSDILSEFEYRQLVSNIEEILTCHRTLLNMLDDQFGKPCKEQRIGGTFLKMAPTLQAAHKLYIANHPKAVCVIEKYKDEFNSFMECHGATTPGTLVLTTALSQPFRRLDKYPGVLQEFHRHIEEFHPDRGDTQRSIHVYRDLTSTCSSIRRQKQLELEMLTNKIQGFEEGETLSILGELLHMRSVALLPDNRDRYLVLFPACLVVLALSSRASSFIFEGKYMLADLAVEKLVDSGQHKNSFKVTGPQMEPIIAVCQSSSDQLHWVELLQKNIQLSRSNGAPNHQKLGTPLHGMIPVPPAHGSPLHPPLSSSASTSVVNNDKKIHLNPWSLSCLRPSPPLRPGFSFRDDKKTSKQTRKKDESWHEDDALLLRVIEYYCSSTKARYTVNSTFLDNPHVLIASEEKIIVEETRGNQVVIEEKSLVDTVYALKDQLSALAQSYQELKNDFEKEKKSTSSLKNIIRQHLQNLDREDLCRETEVVI